MEKLYQVLLFNDDSHSFEDVIKALITSQIHFSLSLVEATLIANTVHQSPCGYAPVFLAFLNEAQGIAARIRTCGLLVEVDEVGDDMLQQLRERFPTMMEESMDDDEKWKMGEGYHTNDESNR